MQVLLLLGGEDVERGEVLAEQQGGFVRQRGQLLGGVDEFGQHLHERVGRHDLRFDAELGEEQRHQARHQVQVEQAVDPGADQRVDLVAGRAVAHQAVGVDGDGCAGEDLGHAERRVDLDRLDGQFHRVVTEVPQEPQMPLPHRDVVEARGPTARVEGGDGLVPRLHVVEAFPQPLEAGRLIEAGGGLGGRRVVADQQDAPVGGAEAVGVEGRGECGGAVQRRRQEDLGGHAAAPAAAGRRRSRRSLVARCMSMESSASSTTSCGMRRRATALIDFSFLATAGSNLSMDPR